MRDSKVIPALGPSSVNRLQRNATDLWTFRKDGGWKRLAFLICWHCGDPL